MAQREFAEHGYAATSLDVVVAGAEVTKGALYHHFRGKQALFEAVFAQVEDAVAERIRARLAAEEDPWAQASAAVHTFLEAMRDPAYRRIVVQDGPSVLGYERFREREERSSFALVHEVTRAVLVASTEATDEVMVETFSRILHGAVSAAGESVADSPDPEASIQRVELAIETILTGLRSLAETGLRLQDPATGS